MRTNDVYSHNVLIIDLEEYAQKQDKARLLEIIRYGTFGNVSYDDVVKAAKLLGVE